MLCERVLEEEGVLGDITLGEFAMEWIPFEDDLISMELDNSTWKELSLVCDCRWINGTLMTICHIWRVLMMVTGIDGHNPEYTNRLYYHLDKRSRMAILLLFIRQLNHL
jgi:hypothetical protein